SCPRTRPCDKGGVHHRPRHRRTTLPRAQGGARVVFVMQAATRVIAVDDQALFRAAARDVIRATAGFELVAEASSGPEAMDLFTRLEPALVLMDVRMPGVDGIETTRRLRALRPDAVVVLISLEDIEDMASAVEQCG